MPVFSPQSFVLNVAVSKKNAANTPIEIVTANNTDKYELSITTVKWDGSAYDADAPVTVYFSDGRTPINTIVAKDVALVIPVTSAAARIIEVTLVVNGSDYFRVVRGLQFSSVA